MVNTKYVCRQTRLGAVSVIKGWTTTADEAVVKTKAYADALKAYVELWVDDTLVAREIPTNADLAWARIDFNHGMTIPKLAKLSGVAERTIQRWEKRRRGKAQYEKREAIMEALGLPWTLHRRLFGD